jgi:hypothetical protein
MKRGFGLSKWNEFFLLHSSAPGDDPRNHRDGTSKPHREPKRGETLPNYGTCADMEKLRFVSLLFVTV